MGRSEVDESERNFSHRNRRLTKIENGEDVMLHA